MDRTTYLRDLMTRHRLAPKDVAALLGVHPSTVYTWRTRGHRQAIPSHKLELLEIKLGLQGVRALDRPVAGRAPA